MREKPHCEIASKTSDCNGIVKRNGWTNETIDGHLWQCPAWKCNKCGQEWWSYFDDDNGDEACDLDDEIDDDEMEYDDE